MDSFENDLVKAAEINRRIRLGYAKVRLAQRLARGAKKEWEKREKDAIEAEAEYDRLLERLKGGIDAESHR